jgi:hypothetical protein
MKPAINARAMIRNEFFIFYWLIGSLSGFGETTAKEILLMCRNADVFVKGA